VQGLRLTKGSHIVVPRLFEHDRAYIFQSPDGRVIFAIPYEDDYTLIGTTDVEYDGPLDAVGVDACEVAYLCERVNRYFARPVAPEDVVWRYAGVRPLLDGEGSDPSALTRDYALELDTAGAPLLNVWGGKITTYRRLAEEAAALLAPHVNGGRAAWTAGAPLPGGDVAAWLGRKPGRPDADFERFVAVLLERHAAAAPTLVRRLARAYGTQAADLLAQPLGAQVAPGLHEAELDHLRRREWARDADDVLWRRSKLGLHLTPPQRDAVAAWMARQTD
jgi:glycerol-3-phosphate dehydrogenase